MNSYLYWAYAHTRRINTFRRGPNIGRNTMRTVSIFKNGNNRAIRLPRDLDFEGVSELEIVREGDSIILRPVRPTWGSFAQLEKADTDFMAEREDVVTDEGRFDL